ncbi:heme/copper-type cytochrome/quinol oxidase subunit 1 [Paenibacillus sp. V4I9]|uniref:hypothetical protein n=1 Tax=Paenibacillus sp. V4I9 TaxID=3042308 RepID=UPI0027818E76|nr:hypothetical protein [Paenibacillus sp. V4I9]MDQ0887959.1 heme/copper-type cytochrome/quinol oxidase subunit 1 [Paenibacillus sp. V4I9]
MSRKSVVAGILLSLSVPMIVFFAVVAITNLGNVQGPPEDFQYHDSYFVVIHIDPYVYPILAVTTFTVYAAIFWVVRYVKRKNL